MLAAVVGGAVTGSFVIARHGDRWGRRRTYRGPLPAAGGDRRRVRVRRAVVGAGDRRAGRGDVDRGRRVGAVHLASSRPCSPPTCAATSSPAGSRSTTRSPPPRARSVRSPPGCRRSPATCGMAPRPTSAGSSRWCPPPLAGAAVARSLVAGRRARRRGRAGGRRSAGARAVAADGAAPCRAVRGRLLRRRVHRERRSSRTGSPTGSTRRPATLGVVFAAVGVLQTLSFLAAGRLAERFGLLTTMVATHLPVQRAARRAGLRAELRGRGRCCCWPGWCCRRWTSPPGRPTSWRWSPRPSGPPRRRRPTAPAT